MTPQLFRAAHMRSYDALLLKPRANALIHAHPPSPQLVASARLIGRDTVGNRCPDDQRDRLLRTPLAMHWMLGSRRRWKCEVVCSMHNALDEGREVDAGGHGHRCKTTRAKRLAQRLIGHVSHPLSPSVCLLRSCLFGRSRLFFRLGSAVFTAVGVGLRELGLALLGLADAA